MTMEDLANDIRVPHAAMSQVVAHVVDCVNGCCSKQQVLGVAIHSEEASMGGLVAARNTKLDKNRSGGGAPDDVPHIISVSTTENAIGGAGLPTGSPPSGPSVEP